MADYNSTHTGQQIDEGVAAALPNGRLDQAIQAAINTAVNRAVAQLAAKIHADQHAAGGTDPITPKAIGALPTAGGDISGVLRVAGGVTGGYFKQREADYGTPNELGQYIDMHMAGSTADYDGRLFLDSQKKLYFQNYGSAAIRLLTTADFDASGASKILVGTYEGAGAHGPKYPCTIECDFAPQAGIVFKLKDDAQGNDLFALFIRGQKGIQVGCVAAREGDYPVYVQQLDGTTWGETNLSWYGGTSSSSYEGGDTQMNDDNSTYGYMIWG